MDYDKSILIYWLKNNNLMILKLQKSVINLYKDHICKYTLFVKTLHLLVTLQWIIIVNQMNLLHLLICILINCIKCKLFGFYVYSGLFIWLNQSPVPLFSAYFHNFVQPTLSFWPSDPKKGTTLLMVCRQFYHRIALVWFFTISLFPYILCLLVFCGCWK